MEKKIKGKYTPTPFNKIQFKIAQAISKLGTFTPEEALVTMRIVNSHKSLLKALKDAYAHLEYCNYGDSWERECAKEEKLGEQIEKAIAQAEGK